MERAAQKGTGNGYDSRQEQSAGIRRLPTRVSVTLDWAEEVIRWWIS
jgi:hypothetical protein